MVELESMLVEAVEAREAEREAAAEERAAEVARADVAQEEAQEAKEEAARVRAAAGLSGTTEGGLVGMAVEVGAAGGTQASSRSTANQGEGCPHH